MWMGKTNNVSYSLQFNVFQPWKMTLLKSLSVLPTPFPNCLSGDFPSGIEGRGSLRGKCRGEGRGWGAYHYLVFEELLQDLMLWPVEWLALVKHSTGIMRAVMLGLLQLSLQFKGVHSSADPLEKHWVYIFPTHTSPIRFFHFHSQCRFSKSFYLHHCHGSFFCHSAHHNLSCWSLPDVHKAKYAEVAWERQKNPSFPGWS